MRWIKGQSGNRRGRPKENVDGYNLPALCRIRTADCVRLWVEVLNDPNAALRDRMKAAELILDRAHGRPVQQARVAFERGTAGARILTDDELMAVIQADAPSRTGGRD